MRSVNSYQDFTFTLQQPSIWKSFYEVRFGDELFGTINIRRKINKQAEVTSADGNWIFEHEGIINPKIYVKSIDDSIITTCKLNAFNKTGVISIDEQEISFKFDVFRNVLDVYSKHDTHIIHFQNRLSGKFYSEINILRPSKRVKRFPLVFFFCCYILLTNRRNFAS